MPISGFPDMAGLNDGQKRRDFVLWVKSILESLATEEQYQNLFVEELRDSVREAWYDDPEAFDNLSRDVYELDDDKVALHGLGGIQLGIKLRIVNYWAGQFMDIGTTFILRKLFDAIDTLLGSLLNALGGGTLLEELKESIWNCLKLEA